MAFTIIVIGGYLLVPTIILFVMSFNVSSSIFVSPAEWGVANWVETWRNPSVLSSLWNSIAVWLGVAAISLPISLAIALVLARTDVPFSRALEFMFWVAFIFPPIASTFGWMYLMTPSWGFLNVLVEQLPFIDKGPFNIYSFEGIVFTRLMADGIAFYVILLTPAFRNMNGALEEASRISGFSNLRTAIRVTLPMMVAPVVLVVSLQLVKVFQGFEVEYILGSRFGFFVYSTLIHQLISVETVPQYPPAIVLASVTLLIVALVIPIQNWVVKRRTYTTVSGNYRPGLQKLGRWRWPAFGAIAVMVAMLTVVPFVIVAVGSFMTRVGFFDIPQVWTMDHWTLVLSDPRFLSALQTTVIIAITSGIVSPILFSIFAYMIVRTRWRGRKVLDSIIWGSAAMPGILLGLGLLIMFLTTPGLKSLFGTIWPLIIVVVIAGKTTGTNVIKGVLVQLGQDLEEAARVSGAGWFRAYFKVVLPVLMPTLVLIGLLNFVGAANTTAPVILLATRETETLSLLALSLGTGGLGRIEAAGVVSIVIMVISLGLALPMRMIAKKMGVRSDMHA